METQGPAAGPFRHASVHDVEDSASISTTPDGQLLQSLVAKIESLEREIRTLSTKPAASFAFDAWCRCSLDQENGRNLVVCIDGTANQFGAKVRELCLDRYSE